MPDATGDGWDVTSSYVGTARVWRRRTGRMFVLLFAFELVGCVAAVGLLGFDVATLVITVAVTTAILLPIGVLGTRQYLAVDGDRMWVRLLRRRGPIPLPEVVVAHWESFNGGTRLVLVQPFAGVRVGFWSAVSTLGVVRPPRYGAGPDGPLRYVALQPWMLTPDALHVLAPPLLRDPHVRMTARTRSILERMAGEL
jgi:hypothetical protein